MKIENWEIKLIDYIEATKLKKFKWGVNDCCSFVAGAVKAMTGVDFYKDYKGKYNDEETAMKALYDVSGYKTIAGMLNNKFEAKQINLAQRGDIVMNDQRAIGICLGSTSAFLTKDGLIFIATHQCIKCWGVQCLKQ